MCFVWCQCEGVCWVSVLLWESCDVCKDGHWCWDQLYWRGLISVSAECLCDQTHHRLQDLKRLSDKETFKTSGTGFEIIENSLYASANVIIFSFSAIWCQTKSAWSVKLIETCFDFCSDFRCSCHWWIRLAWAAEPQNDLFQAFAWGPERFPYDNTMQEGNEEVQRNP